MKQPIFPNAFPVVTTTSICWVQEWADCCKQNNVLEAAPRHDISDNGLSDTCQGWTHKKHCFLLPFLAALEKKVNKKIKA